MSKPLRFVLLGHPVGHSLSPSIHQAVYDVYRLPHRYELVDCATPAEVAQQVAELRAGRVAGANITVPWKRTALELADAAHSSAQDTGAANVLLLDGRGAVTAHNTDAPALARIVQSGAPSPDQRGALILGNGGAALAAVVAATSAGFSTVYVSARRWHSGLAAAEGSAEFVSLGAQPLVWSERVFGTVAPNLGLVVQATSAGMTGIGGGEELAAMMPWSRLPNDAFIYDVVYNPSLTPVLQQARAAGLSAEGGLSMLVGQAALAIELWLGIEPPLELMAERARTAMHERTLGGARAHNRAKEPGA